MRLVVCGGGTGGHIYPALAVADEVKHRDASAEVLYIGSANSMEQKIVPKAGHRFASVNIQPLSRSSKFEAVKALAGLPGAVKQAYRLLQEYKPDVILGTGGYASYPVLVAGNILKQCTVIHEQNALPGLANRRLASRVDLVLLTFEEALKYMKPKRYLVSGFPVRREVGRIERQEARKRMGLDPEAFTLLVFGGSLGAMSINQATLQYIGGLDSGTDMQILWSCGGDNYNEVNKLLQNVMPVGTSLKIALKEYIHDMPAALAAADVALCRAGAGTISELALAGLPSILVPYPYAAENHQQKNAEAMAARGAALAVPDRELTGEAVKNLVEMLRYDTRSREAMALNMKRQSRPGALDEITDKIIELATR